MKEINFDIECWYNCNNKEIENSKGFDCRKTCQRYLYMNFLIINCGKPDSENFIKKLIPDKSDKKAFDRLKVIKENIKTYIKDGNNLYIHSKHIQNGKTTWAIKIMYRYFHEIWYGSDLSPKGYFIYVPEFLNNMKNFEYRKTKECNELEEIINSADIVIWDDITFKLSTQEQTILQNYINKRFLNHKSNIFTGFDDGQIENNIGIRLYKMLTSCEDIEFISTRYEIQK